MLARGSNFSQGPVGWRPKIASYPLAFEEHAGHPLTQPVPHRDHARLPRVGRPASQFRGALAADVIREAWLRCSSGPKGLY